MDNEENPDTLKQNFISKGSELSDKIAKESGYEGVGSGKALAKDLYTAGVISKETKDALLEGVDKRNDIGHPYGKQKTDVNTNISKSDVTKFSDAVDEVSNKVADDIDMNF